jgi:putative CocE/NonD family hydrolase
MEEELWAYLDKHLKGDAGIEEKHIDYFTLGENKWKRTAVWPPAGMKMESWYFDKDLRLAEEQPKIPEGSDQYRVDFTASTGQSGRWMSQMGVRIEYQDRREEDRKLLTYTSEPLREDLEVTGSPVIRLKVASTHSDGAFHVYLEDVGPDGRVSYLTEGVLRAVHRKLTDPESAPFEPLGPYHSFKRQDAMPLVPDEVADIVITMLPVSVKFMRGHRIRVAIAGYDDVIGAKHPAGEVPTLTVQRNSVNASYIELPVIK